jgi:hypothetical protein
MELTWKKVSIDMPIGDYLFWPKGWDRPTPGFWYPIDTYVRVDISLGSLREYGESHKIPFHVAKNWYCVRLNGSINPWKASEFQS